MTGTTSACRHCGGPVVGLPECRWCGITVATIGEAADRLWGEGEAEPRRQDIHTDPRSKGAYSEEEGP